MEQQTRISIEGSGGIRTFGTDRETAAQISKDPSSPDETPLAPAYSARQPANRVQTDSAPSPLQAGDSYESALRANDRSPTFRARAQSTRESEQDRSLAAPTEYVKFNGLEDAANSQAVTDQSSASRERPAAHLDIGGDRNVARRTPGDSSSSARQEEASLDMPRADAPRDSAISDRRDMSPPKEGRSKEPHAAFVQTPSAPDREDAVIAAIQTHVDSTNLTLAERQTVMNRVQENITRSASLGKAATSSEQAFRHYYPQPETDKHKELDR